MLEERPAAVTYVGLPIGSGGAHSLGRMSRRTAYAHTMTFLETCTELVEPLSYSITVHDVPQLPPQRALEAELTRRFGHARPVRLQDAQVLAALDFLDDVAPQATNEWGMAPVWFQVRANFRLLDPSLGRPLAGQDPGRFAGVEYQWAVPLGTSGLRLFMDNKASLAVEFCIPDPDAELLAAVVPWLQAYLPFKMSPHHWRSWTRTASGSFRARKLASHLV